MGNIVPDIHTGKTDLAEKEVLGILLFQPQRMPRAVELGLEPGLFLASYHAAIWEALGALQRDGETVTYAGVWGRMTAQGTAALLQPLGSEEYLVNLANECGAADGLADHIAAMKIAAIEREQSKTREALRQAQGPGHKRELLQRIAALTAEHDAILAGVEGWPEPAPLPAGLPDVPVMTPEMLPEPLRPWLLDAAERMQCPIDYLGVGAMVALSAIVGRRCAIRPKQHDSFTVVPNLWGGVVGPPGVLKTPALEEATRPLVDLEREASAEHQRAMQEYKVVEAKRSSLERRLRAAEERGDEETDSQLREQLLAMDSEAPIPRRYIVNDPTVERLGELLQQNPRGLLLMRDELTGWLRSLDRQGHETDRAFYLEAWKGDSGFTFDRVRRGTVRIEAMCLSILGSIQPGPLSELIRCAVRPGVEADGLIQRFQLLVYPEMPTVFRHVDRAPDSAARARAFALYRGLDQLDAAAVGARTDEEGGLPFLRFEDRAQALADTFASAMATATRRPDEHPAMQAHLSKYRSLMPSIALVIHLIDCLDGRRKGAVSVSATQKALRWCEYLEAHARRIYNLARDGETSPARILGARIKSRALPLVFSGREVYQHGWTGLPDPPAVAKAAAVLVEHDWLRVERQQTSGRPRTVYRVNPKVIQ